MTIPVLCGCALLPAPAAGTGWDPWAPAEAPIPSLAVEPATAPDRLFGLAAIRLYQFILSPALGGRCQFEPSCSRYAFACIANHGLFIGTWAGADRISRCHGFAGSGDYPELDDGRLADPPRR